VRALLLLLAAVSGCGRIAFDPREDAQVDVAADAPQCPAGYTFEAETGSCYRASATPLAWLAAEAACEAEGAHLVAISDATEAAVADRYRNAAADFAWIGASDLAFEGSYVTVVNEPASYLMFATGEPDGPANDCLLLRTSLEIGDGDCGTADDYICEYDGRRGASPAWGVCPVSYTFSGRGCYRARVGISGGDYSWLDAEALCEADVAGAHLAVIESSQELADADAVAAARAIADYWIGLSDLATEGVYVSVTNTMPSYLPWNGAPTGGTALNCVRASAGIYSDQPCETGDDVMCEYDAIAPVPAAWGQ
jgi:hypothetical protein